MAGCPDLCLDDNKRHIQDNSSGGLRGATLKKFLDHLLQTIANVGNALFDKFYSIFGQILRIIF